MKKFLKLLCFALIFFALGMAVRHIYDKYYLKLEPASAHSDGPQLHLVVEPVKELPEKLKLKIYDQSTQ